MRPNAHPGHRERVAQAEALLARREAQVATKSVRAGQIKIVDFLYLRGEVQPDLWANLILPCRPVCAGCQA